MTWATIVSDSIVSVINNLPDSFLAVVTEQTGVEEILYPYFNAELIRHYNIKDISGIGYGKLGINSVEKIDCLVITNTEVKIAIELKGPSQTAFLLAGASGSYEDTKVSECLKNVYNENGAIADVHPDSHVGDTLKLINIINRGELKRAYCVGLLKYTQTSIKEKDKYLRKLQAMLHCFKDINTITLNLTCHNIDQKHIFISIIEILSKN